MPAPHAHIPFQKIPEHMGFMRKQRLDLEIYFGAAALDAVSADDIKALRNDLDYGPAISIHAPFMDLSPGAVDPKVREVTMERFNHVLDVAAILAPETIVFHSGYEKWKYAMNVDLWLEKSLQTWAPLNERAASLCIRIAIENIFEDEPGNLRLLMEKMDSPNFGVCFDTGHCNLFSRLPLEEWMNALNPYILELHLHDNDGTADQHRPMGEGTFDFRKFFRLLKNRDCVYTLEAHSPEDLMASMKYLKTLSP